MVYINSGGIHFIPSNSKNKTNIMSLLDYTLPLPEKDSIDLQKLAKEIFDRDYSEE